MRNGGRGTRRSVPIFPDGYSLVRELRPIRYNIRLTRGGVFGQVRDRSNWVRSANLTALSAPTVKPRFASKKVFGSGASRVSAATCTWQRPSCQTTHARGQTRFDEALPLQNEPILTRHTTARGRRFERALHGNRMVSLRGLGKERIGLVQRGVSSWGIFMCNVLMVNVLHIGKDSATVLMEPASRSSRRIRRLAISIAAIL